MQAFRAPHAFDGHRFLPGGATLIVDDGRVVALEEGFVDLPDDVVVTEHTGTLLPGLVDCHTHLVADATFGGLERAGVLSDAELDAVVLASLRAHAAAGETTVRDLGDVGYRTLAFRDRPGLPRVVAAGPPLTRTGGHCHFLGGAVSGDGRDDVARHVEHGVDVVKVMASGGFATAGTDPLAAQFEADELAVLVDEAHRAGLPLVAHAHSLAGIENAVAAGVDGIEHFSGLHAGGLEVDDTLLDEVARRGIVVDLTTGNDLALLGVMPPPPPHVAALAARLGLGRFEDVYAAQLAKIPRLREHGITLVTGVDSGMIPAKRHGNVRIVVRELVEHGCSPAEALAAATSVAARACRLATVTGRLAPGLSADVLVAEGDLGTDVSGLDRPLAVLVRGVAVDLGDPAAQDPAACLPQSST